MLTYIKTLSAKTDWSFDLITFEQPQFKINGNDQFRIKSELLLYNILWHPKNHLTGSFLLIKKAYNLLSLFPLLIKLKISGTEIIWSFANISASIAWVYSRLFRLKTLIFSYEPHSDFMYELGIWNHNSLKYRILSYLERRAGIDADYVLTGTSYMRDKLLREKKFGKVFRAPTSVDENDFYYRGDSVQIVKGRHGIKPNEKIIIYVGKFGDLYYTFQTIVFFKIVSEYNGLNLRFIVITPNAKEEIRQYCIQADFDVNEIIYLSNIPYEEIKIYMSGASLGISAVPPSPSQKYRSPTKVAEYLLCGLPFITCSGVSEDDIMVLKNEGIGVVLKDFSEDSIKEKLPEIADILSRRKEETVQKCREVGLKYRAKSTIDKLFYKIFSEL